MYLSNIERKKPNIDRLSFHNHKKTASCAFFVYRIRSLDHNPELNRISSVYKISAESNRIPIGIQYGSDGIRLSE